MIEHYFAELGKSISQFPAVRSVSVTKKIYNTKQGYINGSIIFENNHRLDFTEVINTDSKSKLKYRYHYMNETQEMLFRYDNAPHHADITTFPHHKHEKNSIKASLEISLYEILLECAALM